MQHAPLLTRKARNMKADLLRIVRAIALGIVTFVREFTKR